MYFTQDYCKSKSITVLAEGDCSPYTHNIRLNVSDIIERLMFESDVYRAVGVRLINRCQNAAVRFAKMLVATPEYRGCTEEELFNGYIPETLGRCVVEHLHKGDYIADVWGECFAAFTSEAEGVA